MAVAERPSLGFSLHLRAEEVIAKFERENEDDFKYLHEILAEAKQHFGRRDSNILLPKTPSMKRKRPESDEEASSDDNTSKTAKGIKAPKTQGYASPLTVINEGELLGCSITNQESKGDDTKRTTRATRAGTQAKRQQPKRGSRKQNLQVVESVTGDQTDSSSLDEKPRRSTRNSRKKKLELEISTTEQGDGVSSNEDNKRPKRSSRNTRKKFLGDAADLSSTEELPSWSVINKSKSSLGKNLEDSGETVSAVLEKQKPVSPVEEDLTQKRSTTLSNSRNGEEKETKNTACVPETPDPADLNVTNEVLSPPASAKICKASVQMVLQSPGFSTGKGKQVTPVTTSSPCVEENYESHQDTAEELAISVQRETTDGVVVAVSSLSPVLTLPDNSSKTHKVQEYESKEEFEGQAKVNHSENTCGAKDGTISKSERDAEREDEEKAVSQVKCVRRSTQRSSGWRRKSKRPSCHLSPANKRLSVKMTVTKSKAPGKKSLIKSSVKLKLTQSKLMPELKLSGSGQKSSDREADNDLKAVRVRLFDDFTSNSGANARTSAGTSSPVERPVEDVAEDDAEEVFHDCRSENEADNEIEEVQEVKTDSDKSPIRKSVISPIAAVHASEGSSSSEGSEPTSVNPPEEPRTPSQEKQEAPHKVKPNNIALVHSFIRRNTPKKVDPEEKKKQLRIALKEKEEKEKERREHLEMQKQREIEERKRRREERAKKAAEQRAAKLQALEEKKRQAHDQRQIIEEKARKQKEKEDEDKRKQRMQKRTELEARKRQEEAARQQRKREQEEEEKRLREALQKKQELEEQERQRKIAEARRNQEHREKELERERELEKQKKLKAIEEKEKRLREKEEEKERKSREEKQKNEREREEKERARIAQLIREKEEAVRREREQRANEERERQEREKKLREEREAALREKKREEEMERERIRALKERQQVTENQKANVSYDSYEMTPPPVKKPASQENYNIADLNSDDSTDDEDNPKKKIPSWARQPALTAAIFKQAYSNMDVDSIFGRVQPLNLEEVFRRQKKRFNQRTSSAIWNSPPLRPVKKGTLV